MDHRQVDLRRRQDDEAAVDFVGIKIIIVAAFLGDLWRETGAVDLEARELGGFLAESGQRLVVALDEMRLVDHQEPAVDQVVVAQQVGFAGGAHRVPLRIPQPLLLHLLHLATRAFAQAGVAQQLFHRRVV